MTIATDKMTILEQEVVRLGMEEKGEAAIAGAKSRLVLVSDARTVFFSNLALHMDEKPSWQIPTAATDGKNILYNPEWISSLPPAEVQGVLAHEVMHCVLEHFARLGNRDMRKANIAMDLAINPMLIEAGFSLPSSVCLPDREPFDKLNLPAEASFEEYYSLLPDEDGNDGGEDGGEDGDEGRLVEGDDPGGCGGVRPAADESGRQADQATQRKLAEDWKRRATQAHQVAKMRGDLPAGIDRLIEGIERPQVPWTEVLTQFVNTTAKNDYDWRKPNRRFASQGMYFPSLQSQELGDLVLAVDTSGSIGTAELRQFAGELQGILDAFDVRLTILYHDTEVSHVQQWETSDGPLKLEARGGGGTSHHCVFDWIERNATEVTAMISLTDLYTSLPDEAPTYPVVWVCTSNEVAPWGQTLPITVKGD